MAQNPYQACVPKYSVYSKVDVYNLWQNLVAVLGNATFWGTGVPTANPTLTALDTDIYKWYVDYSTGNIYNFINGGWGSPLSHINFSSGTISSGSAILNGTLVQSGANFNIDGNGVIGGSLTMGGPINGTSQYLFQGLSIAGNSSAHDPYGTLSVINPTDGNNYNYLAFTRVGQSIWTQGIDTNNRYILGIGGTKGFSGIKGTTYLAIDYLGNPVFTNGITAPKFIVPGGSPNTFLMQDGSFNTNTYLTSVTFANHTDVQLTGLSSGQILQYNGSKWVNVAAASGGGGGGSTTLSALTDVSLSGLTSSQYLQYNGTKWVNVTLPNYLTSVTSTAVTGALGFVPYNSTNPNNYITSSALSPYLTTATASTTYQPIGSYLTSNQNITISGDASGSGTTTLSLTLASVNSNVGTWNNVTVNAKGLVTSASNVSYLTGNQSITFTVSGDLTGTASGTTTLSPNLTLATVNSNVGTFNTVTVNAKGLVTAASNTSYLTANQSITISGDISGSGTTSIALTLPVVNANVGTWNNVTVNAKGLVTAGSNVSYLTANQSISFAPVGTGDVTGSSSGTTSLTPTLTLATITQGSSGTSFVKLGLDTKGRVINNTAVTTSDLTPLLNGTYLTGNQNITLTGDITGSGTTNITTTLKPITQAATGTSFSKFAVDGYGRVVSSFGVGSSDIITALGYTPFNGTGAIGIYQSSYFNTNSGTTSYTSYTTYAPSGTTYTYTAASGISSTGSSNGYTDVYYYAQNLYFAECQITSTVKVNTVGSGAAIFYGNTTAYGEFVVNTSTGILTIVASAHVVATSVNALTINAGDVLNLSVVRDNATYSFTVTNTTTPGTASIKYVQALSTTAYSFGGSYPTWVGICTVGGSYLYQNIVYMVNTQLNPYIVHIGDSITQGYNCTIANTTLDVPTAADPNNAYGRIAANSFNLGKRYVQLAQSGGSISDITNYTTQMGVLKPTYAIMSMGKNDSAQGLTNFTNYLKQFISYCLNNNIIPILTTIIPDLTYNAVIISYNTLINTYANDGYVIDLWTPLAMPGTGTFNVAYSSNGNNIHPSLEGHILMAQTMITAFQTFGFQSSGSRILTGNLYISNHLFNNASSKVDDLKPVLTEYPFSSTINPNFTSTSQLTYKVSSNVTIGYPVGMEPGQVRYLRLTNLGTYVITWANYAFVGSVPPTLSSNATDLFRITYDGTLYYLEPLQNIGNQTAWTQNINFNANAQSIAGWQDVSGNPSTGVVTKALSNGVTISTVATANWTSFSGSLSAYNTLNTTTWGNSIIPATVMNSGFESYVAAGAYVKTKTGALLQFSGLDTTGTYNLEIFSSSVYKQGTNTVVAFSVNGLNNDQNVTYYNNTSQVLYFNNISPDGTGIIWINGGSTLGNATMPINAIVLSKVGSTTAATLGTGQMVYQTGTFNGSVITKGQGMNMTFTGTSNYTTSTSDEVIICNNGSTAITINLTTPSYPQRIYIHRGTATTNTGTITLTPASGSIEQYFTGQSGSTTVLNTLSSGGSRLCIVWDPTNTVWYILSSF